jgi:inner membrane protease subunit 2
MLGTVVSWIPVYITFTDHVGRISSVNGPSMYPFLNTDYNSSTARDYVYISMRNPGLGLERGMIVAFW